MCFHKCFVDTIVSVAMQIKVCMCVCVWFICTLCVCVMAARNLCACACVSFVYARGCMAQGLTHCTCICRYKERKRVRV